MAAFESATTRWQLFTRQRLGGMSYLEQWYYAVYLCLMPTRFGRIAQQLVPYFTFTPFPLDWYPTTPTFEFEILKRRRFAEWVHWATERAA